MGLHRATKRQLRKAHPKPYNTSVIQRCQHSRTALCASSSTTAPTKSRLSAFWPFTRSCRQSQWRVPSMTGHIRGSPSMVVGLTGPLGTGCKHVPVVQRREPRTLSPLSASHCLTEVRLIFLSSAWVPLSCDHEATARHQLRCQNSAWLIDVSNVVCVGSLLACNSSASSVQQGNSKLQFAHIYRTCLRDKCAQCDD